MAIDRFIDKRSRTHDQMVQAARSGKQNILEGSRAGGTSEETELKPTTWPAPGGNFQTIVQRAYRLTSVRAA
jgi:hypothetical protein